MDVKLSKAWYCFCNKIRNTINRLKLKKGPRTIISSNCTGGFISHWLGLRFNSPTVNLFISPKDFIIMLKDFDFYFNSSTEIHECFNHDKTYPVAEFETGVKIYFMHYASFEEAICKWKQRCDRIDKSKLYIIMAERDCCTEEDLLNFDNLQYKNKVALVHKNYPNVSCSYYIPGFELDDGVGQLHHVANRFTGKRYLDAFDYVAFLNRD